MALKGFLDATEGSAAVLIRKSFWSTLYSFSVAEYTFQSKKRHLRFSHKCLIIINGQFLIGIAVPNSDLGITSTQDKDFTDKPYMVIL